MLGTREMTFEDYRSILRRRGGILIVASILGVAIGFAVFEHAPKRYTSETTVLVQPPAVSVAPPVITQEMNQRLNTMQQQILSRTRLEPIIKKYGLDRNKDGDPIVMDYAVDGLRSAVAVTPLRPIAGVESRTLPGFTISVTMNNPNLAQKICEQIADEFIKENLSARTATATGTTTFFRDQLADAKRILDEQDAKLAEFKRRHIGQLPGNEAANLALLTTSKTQLDGVIATLNRAQQDKTFIESQLQQQLSAWQGTETAANPVTLDTQLADMQRELATLESRYTPEHPDVIKKKNDIAALRRRIDAVNSNAGKKPTESSRASLIEPPAITMLRNQIHQLEVTIKEKNREQDRLQEDIRLYQGRVQSSPMVEQQFKDLTRDYTTALTYYDDLKRKKDQSELAEQLEGSQQAEQFKVLDPPRIPETPNTPPRMVFLLGGLFGGLALGVVAIVVIEFQDKSIRTERDVEVLLQVPTLAMVPVIDIKKGTGGLLNRNRGVLST